MIFTGPVLYLAVTSSEIVKIFLDSLIVLVYLDNNPEIYFNYFLRSLVKMTKYITGAHASVHFEIGPYAKSVEKH